MFRRIVKLSPWVILPVLLLGFAIQASVLQAPSSGSWAPVPGTLAEATSGAASALLPDGRILVTGGAGPTASAEFFNLDGSFSSAPAMAFARQGHTAVTLQDGRVLVSGGTTAGDAMTDTAEIYDPATNAWTTTGLLIVPHSGHTATLLQDGRVLVAGGENSGGASNTVEVFNPVSGTSSLTAGVMSSARAQHAAAALPDGRVLIAGGSDGSSALASTDVFDPLTDFVAPGPALGAPRQGLSATTLLDGTVLIAGGSTTAPDGSAQDLASAEIFNSAIGTFTAASSSLATARSGHLAILLPHNNSVLIVGGTSAGSAVASAELYRPWNGQFTATGSMASARASAAGGSSAGLDGVLVVAGGNDGTNNLSSAEAYGFATLKTDKGDYAPGEIVTITGSGWQPGETVSLLLHESNNPDPHPDRTITAVADDAGNILDNSFSPESHDVGVRFYLTATGANSQAQTTFTDNVTAVSVNSPTSVSPVTLTALPGNVTVSFTYSTSATGATSAVARICSSAACSPAGTILASNSKSSMANGTSITDTIVVTVPAGTANSPAGSPYTVQVEVNNTATPPGPTTRTDTKTGAVIINVPTNTAPTASGKSVTTNEDTPIVITLSGSDADGNTLTFVVGVPSNGSLGSFGPVGCVGTVPKTCTQDVTYTPAADYNGLDSFTFKVNDGTVDSAPATVSITVTAVNDAPSFSKGADQTVLEDAGAQSVASWATGISAGPSDESGQTLTFNVTGNTNPSLFSAGPAVSSVGTLTYTPAPDANGSAMITLQLMDGGGTANGGVDTSAPQTFAINITAVNDAPSFTKGADQTVLEDAGPQSVSSWATAISAGPANESVQVLTFQVAGNTNPGLFSAGPAVAADGTLTYTTAADANGSATITLDLKDDGGIANGGVDTSAPQTFVINVTAVNDAPSFTKGADQTVLEDAGAQSVPLWATNISPGPADESSQSVSFLVTNDNNSLFLVQPVVSAGGTLTYTPAPDANGPATVSVKAKDNGGTADGGVDESAAQTFTITVTPVNDAPSFTKGADPTSLEDAGLKSFAGWATNVSAGPANESGQTLTFIITNNTNPGLFSVGPAVAANGTLTYTTAANANGSATITLKLMDDGGTENSGVDTSPEQTFTINVTPVNDAPSFTKGADQSVLVNAGPQTVTPWATGISAGPTDESGQVLNFIVSNNNNALFSAQPAIAANGTLTYTPALNAAGSATVTVQLHDNGGMADGGVDTSAAQTFTISVLYSAACNLGTGHQILQPINSDGTSVFKQKNTVPAKFQVCDAGGNSVGPTTAFPNVVSAFNIVGIITGTTTTDVTAAVDSTTPDTMFRWSSTDQQWIFNTYTKNLSADKTYIFRITLLDGSTIQYQFGLR